MLLVFWIVLFASGPAFGQRSSPSDARIQYQLQLAQEAERVQDYAAASRHYEEILKLQPKFALIRQSLGITYHLQNLFPEAIEEFRRALAIDPKLWGSLLFLGMDYYKTNQFALALAPLEKTIELNAGKTEPEARFWLGLAYAALSKPEQAAQQLRRALQLRPGDIEVLFRLALAYDQCAAALFEKLGAIDPHAAVVSLLQAERFSTQGRADLAAIEYSNAVRLRPDLDGWIPGLAAARSSGKSAAGPEISAYDAGAALHFAQWIATQGDSAWASALLTQLTTAKPAGSRAAGLIEQARAALGRLRGSQTAPTDALQGIRLLRQRRFPDASALLAVGAERDRSIYPRLALARAYSESGECDRAEKILYELLAAEPQNLDAMHLLGRNYKHFAEVTLQKMIDIDPDSYAVHQLLGERHEEHTEYGPAIKEYEAAVAKRPDAAGVRYAIGNVYWRMGKQQEAETWLTEELKRNPYHGLAHYRLGSIYIEEGKPDEAIAHLEQALRTHPDLTRAQFDLGRAYAAKGRYEDAISALAKVAAADPDDDRVHYLLSQAFVKLGRLSEGRAEMAKYQELTRKRLERVQHDVNAVSDLVNQQHQ